MTETGRLASLGPKKREIEEKYASCVFQLVIKAILTLKYILLWKKYISAIQKAPLRKIWNRELVKKKSSNMCYPVKDEAGVGILDSSLSVINESRNQRSRVRFY